MTASGLYHYKEYKEMGMRARKANVPKHQMKEDTLNGLCLTRTQKAFWVLGWEEQDRLMSQE